MIGETQSKIKPPHRSARLQQRGMTLVECLLAMVIMATAVLGIAHTTSSGHMHLRSSDDRLRALRVAEHMLEEINSKPYYGTGSDRSTFCLDDYDQYHEPLGVLTRISGEVYPPADQHFSRIVSVVTDTLTLGDMGGAVIPGKRITVTVSTETGYEEDFSRFIAEPYAP